MRPVLLASAPRRAMASVAALVILALVVVGFALILGGSPRQTPATSSLRATPVCTMTVIEESASYVRAYDTLRELRDASDLIVVGTAGQSSALSAPGGGIVSDVTVRVEQIVAAKPEANAQGGALQSGGRIVVEQQGGVLGCREMINSDDPLMRQGDHVILFLHLIGPGEYYPLTGPEGRFIIDAQGIVHPANPTFTVRVPHNLTVDQFLAEIAAV